MPKPKKLKKPDLISNEKEKILVMWSGVTFFMVLILVFWGINFKQAIKKTEDRSNGNEINWDKIASDLSNTVGQVKEEISDLKSVTEGGAEIATSTGNIIQTGAEIATSTKSMTQEEEIAALKTRLEELEKKNQ